MTPDGVASVQARISAIEHRWGIGTVASAPAAAPATGSGTVAASDFDALLARVQSAYSPSGLGGTGTLAGHDDHVHVHSGEMGAAGAPAELAAYGNGRIPPDALEPIGQGNHRLWGPAARQFRAMAEAAAREGITIRVSDSYRTYDEQVRLAETKGIYGQGGLAAVPGTSNHGWGRALDIDTAGGTAEWLRANATRFGFHEDVPGEPWHWTYRPA